MDCLGAGSFTFVFLQGLFWEIILVGLWYASPGIELEVDISI